MLKTSWDAVTTITIIKYFRHGRFCTKSSIENCPDHVDKEIVEKNYSFEGLKHNLTIMDDCQDFVNVDLDL